MTNIIAVFKKQLKDTLKNKTVLIQFIMFPVLTFIMNSAIQSDDMPVNYFVNLFATMYIGMAPLVSMTEIVSEEKEKNTLRVMLMSNVKPYEYLIGVGGYIWCLCMLGSIAFCLEGGYHGMDAAVFLTIMAVGILVSVLIGAAIGTWSRNQMRATSITVPVMMVFSFLPMLSMFNKTIAKVAKFTYSDQISMMMNHIHDIDIHASNLAVICVNMSIAVILFLIAYRKCGLE